MKVTDKNYYMDEKLIGKLDLMCDRCSGHRKFDNVIIVDGPEGYGKTNVGFGGAYYQAWKLGRELKYFFNLDDMIEYAKKTEEKVIIWDEGALGGLAQEHWNKSQRRLIKFLMISRKKRHIYWIHIPRFYRLNEYLAKDRSIALIHVYSPDEINLGLFAYFNVAAKDRLYDDLKKKKVKTYKKHYNFIGKFRMVIGLVVDEDEYDREKEKAIMGVDGEEKLKPEDIERMTKIKLLTQIREKRPDITIAQLAKMFGISERNSYRLLKGGRSLQTANCQHI